MPYQEIERLIDKLDQSDVAYLEYRSEDAQIILSKKVPQLQQASQQEVVAQPTEVSPVLTPSNELPEPPAAIANGTEVSAPLVGVVYLQPKPDAEPYVNVGDEVQKGDVLCLVEAMKLMNEIQAPVSGVVREILVTNESVVEYGQTLFVIG